MKFFTLFLSVLLIAAGGRAQYAPPAGQEGSTAINVDSAVFVDWANQCDVQRGWVNIADTTLGKAGYGSPLSATGKADNNVVSLGDGGVATLYFDKPVVNGAGYDFAVFENAFSDDFLELAFVEVSSDSLNFYRFPAVSNTQIDSQVETFGTLDATKIYNLAGKYRLFYGVPFNLEEMKNIPGLDVNNIVAVRVVDVVGSIDTAYGSFDSEGKIINDPWPTPFESGGFDLDAVGVIHNSATAVNNIIASKMAIYPNPCRNFIFIRGVKGKVKIVDISGKLLKYCTLTSDGRVDVSDLPSGFLLVDVISLNNRHHVLKLIKN